MSYVFIIIIVMIESDSLVSMSVLKICYVPGHLQICTHVAVCIFGEF